MPELGAPAAAQIRTARSSPAVAIQVSSGAIVTAFTGPVVAGEGGAGAGRPFPPAAWNGALAGYMKVPLLDDGEVSEDHRARPLHVRPHGVSEDARLGGEFERVAFVSTGSDEVDAARSTHLEE